jgi:hypothetical protein
VVDNSFVEEAWPEPRPNTIYVISCNTFPLDHLPADFLRKVEHTEGVGLLHASDEWLGGVSDAYRSFKFVIRTHWRSGLAKRGILTVPLGFPKNTTKTSGLTRASARKNAWMFFGNKIATRLEMLRAFEQLPGRAKAGDGRVSHEQYCEMMRDTVFIPAPMGNVMAETWRFYEALEFGCIPLIEKRLTLDYYKELFGDHPIPTFSRWGEAAKFAKDLTSKPQELDALQSTINDWWTDKKQSLVSTVSAFVRDGASGVFLDDLKHLSVSPLPLRLTTQYLELLRHQSLESSYLLAKKCLQRGTPKMPF